MGVDAGGPAQPFLDGGIVEYAAKGAGQGIGATAREQLHRTG